MNHCQNCNKETENPKYCSHSCAATINGKLFPKRRPQGHCKNCKISIPTSHKYCKECSPNGKQWLSQTLGQLKASFRQTYWKELLRMNSRSVYKRSNKPLKCVICGYEKFVDICHIKPVKDFSDNELIININNIENLTCLCPNHHKEFDNHLIKLQNHR